MKQVKDCVQKLGISSSCVRSITTISQREQDAFSIGCKRMTEDVSLDVENLQECRK